MAASGIEEWAIWARMAEIRGKRQDDDTTYSGFG
jgi:hypothetical protein